MTEQERLVALYLAMTPWARNELVAMAGDYAEAWPAKRRPHLQLVPSSKAASQQQGKGRI